jgi:PAS domain S-box-containing protein
MRRRRRRRLVWKLSVVVMATVALVILATGLVTNFTSRHFAQETARSVMHFNSTSLRKGIDRLMMSRDNCGVRELISDVSRGSDIYRDISLVSHPDGEVVVSGRDESETVLQQTDRSCRLCHTGEELPVPSETPLDTVYRDDHGGRVLHVVTPILNGERCQTADCHAHTDSGPILGFLRTNYSFAEVDTLLERQWGLLTLAALLALILATSALYLMFKRLLDQPIRSLFRGLGALARHDLDFRFPAERKDEIGYVEHSFNRLAARLQANEEELLEAHEYFEGIVENSADLIITVNPEGLIETFNRGAEEALGYDRDEVIGQRIEMLFADPGERDVAIRRLEERDNVTNYETRFLTKDGEIRHVLLTLSRLRDRDGNPIGTFGISKDLTVEKDLQERLLRSEQIAAIGRAVTGIQHAIKNMLNTLRGGLYVAEVGHKKSDEDLFEEGCTMLKEGLSRIADLSLNMLTYAREWTIDPEPTDLVHLLQQVEAAVRQEAKDRGVTFHTEGDPNLPAVPCDPRLIHMVLMDLVTNALDACEMKEYEAGETPEIALRASLAAEGTSVVIEVGDNGVGMSREEAADVFAPFVTHKKWGTGLGLPLAARIIKLHEGILDVESQPDRGATFRIVLPLRGTGTSQGNDNGQESPDH